jgi:hypothetical protein
MDQARIEFSRDHYCPLQRVTGRAADAIAPPPSAAIAQDPERLAMWRTAAVKRAGPRRLVAVNGCGEQALYACWTLGGYQPSRRGMHYVTIGAACLAEDDHGGPESALSSDLGRPQLGTDRVARPACSP